MKKSIFLSFASVAMILASCSSEESFKVPFIPGNSEVEISLSSGTPSLTTRAAIENNDAIEGMGVYCVARTSNEGNAAINWNNTSEDDPACIMNNVKANKASGAETAKCDVTWAEAGAKYYYPAFVKYNYDFYGYYPHSKEAKVNEAGDEISVDYTIDGETDIIWGKASTNDKDAYNANYFRNIEDPKENPNLKLDHMLTRLIFQVEQVEGEPGENVIPMTLDEVVLLNVPTNCTLNIADQINTPIESRLALNGDAKEDLALNSVLLPCDTKVKNGTLIEKTVNLGSGLMIYPQKEFKVRLSMTQHDENAEESETPSDDNDETTEPETPTDDNNDDTTEPSEPTDDNSDETTEPADDEVVPEPSNAPDDPSKTTSRDITLTLAGGASFEAGKAYIITVKVYGPRKIEVTATLTPWVKVNGPLIEF